MRENGVPEFPDPELNGDGGMMMKLPNGIDQEAMEKASEACEEFRPKGGGNFSEEDRAEMEETMLEYADCMRENGVPDFPDPDFSEGGARLGGKGIDPEDPAFEKANKACEEVLGDARTDAEGRMSRERLPRRHRRMVAAAVATPVLVGAGLGIAFTRDGSEAEASETLRRRRSPRSAVLSWTASGSPASSGTTRS